MFQIEEKQNSVADSFRRKEFGFINILPLDNIPVNLPKWWTFKSTCMPIQYKSRAEAFANFEVRQDDVWIVTYPKCGTTWTQEMAWMLVNDLNFDEANSVDITERSIFFEMDIIIPQKTWTNFELLNNKKIPRVIKSHLPIGLLPRDIWRKKCKIIYVTRDPKDMFVSYYYHIIGTRSCILSIDEFVEQMLTDNMFYCSFWNHVLEFWLIREQENILFLTYEDMKRDLNSIIRQTSTFLKKDYTQEQIRLLVEHLSFGNMKGRTELFNKKRSQVNNVCSFFIYIASSTCNNQTLVRNLQAGYKVEYDEKTSFKFMRKGLVGEYKKELELSHIKRINARTKEMFEPHDLHLYY